MSKINVKITMAIANPDGSLQRIYDSISKKEFYSIDFLKKRETKLQQLKQELNVAIGLVNKKEDESQKLRKENERLREELKDLRNSEDVERIEKQRELVNNSPQYKIH